MPFGRGLGAGREETARDTANLYAYLRTIHELFTYVEDFGNQASREKAFKSPVSCSTSTLEGMSK
ncbi:hypothetical protein PSCLAVI8L_320048 [Pseudoclavibacter sp. 8L]|nr:hypothetical protein PSCLAVI8L_320048 [Pseudoclavibacter sp. 8L]